METKQETQPIEENIVATPAAQEMLEPETAVATRSSGLSMVLNDATAIPDMRGIAPPRLQLTHGVGGLSASGFNPGDLVLAKEHLLSTRNGPPLRVICLNYKQYWKEYLSATLFNSGVRPRVWPSEAEVHKAGLTTTWIGGIGPQASLGMDWFMLIEQPKDLKCGLFGVTIGGKDYAPAVMSFDKTVYQFVAQTFLPAAAYALRKRGVWSAVWEMTTKLLQPKKQGGNPKWVIQLRLADHLPAETVAEIQKEFGSIPVVPVAVAEPEEPADA